MQLEARRERRRRRSAAFTARNYFPGAQNLSSIGRSLLTTNSLVVLAMLVGLANNIAIAALFGLTRPVDAFYAAQMLPNLFMILFVDYLGKNFLPTLARARKQSDALASEVTSSVITIVALASLAVAALLATASGPLFRTLLPGFSPGDIELAQRHFFIMAPAVVLMAVTTFHQYVSQYDDRYVQITAIHAVLPATNLTAILLAGPYIDEYALPLGYLLGHLIVFVLMARRARYRYSWRIKLRSDWEGKVFTNSAIVMGSGMVARTRTLMMNYFGSLLGDGAIAALALATKLAEPLKRSIFTAARMLMFSRAVRAAAEGNGKDIARLVDLGIGTSFLVLAPLVWWIALNSDVLVETLLLRGEFDLQMAAVVALALIGLAPTIVLDGVGSFVSSAYYALDRIKVTALVTPLGALLYLGIAPFFSGRYGVLGLTLAMSISTALYVGILLALLPRHLPHLRVGKVAAKAFAYTVIAGVCVGMPVAVSSALNWPPLGVAGLSLVVGPALSAVVLLVLRDPLLGVVQSSFRKPLSLHSAGPAA